MDYVVGEQYWCSQLNQGVTLIEIDDSEYFQYLVENSIGKRYWVCTEHLTVLED